LAQVLIVLPSQPRVRVNGAWVTLLTLVLVVTVLWAAKAILLPLALGAAVPLCVYAVRQGDLVTGLGDVEDIYYVACGLGLVLAFQAVFAGLRPRGSRWLPRFVALVAAWVGLAAIIWSHDVTSPGRGWGVALVCWALLFLAGAELEARRDPVRDETVALRPHRAPQG
jgi:hypothetical protein